MTMLSSWIKFLKKAKYLCHFELLYILLGIFVVFFVCLFVYWSMCKGLIVFPPQLGDFDSFTAEKHPNLGTRAHKLLDKNWATLKLLAAGEKPSLLWFGTLKFWQHCLWTFWTPSLFIWTQVGASLEPAGCNILSNLS